VNNANLLAPSSTNFGRNVSGGFWRTEATIEILLRRTFMRFSSNPVDSS